jgi:glycosyltransferase involved in cell wall biosynthesis
MSQARPKGEARRAGGVYIGAHVDEVLRAALARFPGAEVTMIPPGDAERLRGAAYLVAPGVPHARTLIEAFAAGVPVIASRQGAHAELVEAGRNGLLFEPGSAADLARCLAWAEAFPERMREMGDFARADYRSRFISAWSYPTLFGERRKAVRA